MALQGGPNDRNLRNLRYFWLSREAPAIGTYVIYETFGGPTIGTHVIYDTFGVPTIGTPPPGQGKTYGTHKENLRKSRAGIN